MDAFEQYAATLPERNNPFHAEASKVLNDYAVEISFKYGVEPPWAKIPGIEKTETTIGDMRTWAALFKTISDDFAGKVLSATYFTKIPYHVRSIEMSYIDTEGIERSYVYEPEYIKDNLTKDIWLAEAERGRRPKGRYWKGDHPIWLMVVIDGLNIDKVLEGQI